jgi:hypothetical protein
MADLKISALPASTTPLAGTEVLPIVQSGATKQVSVANLTVGRDTTTGRLTAGTGVDALTGNGTGQVILSGAGQTLNTPGRPTLYHKNGVGLGVYSDYAIDFEVNGGTSKIVAGKFTETGNLNVLVGNVVMSTSGKGIDFSATPGTGTSELLADYEEGTWTPTFATGWTTAPTVANANYTKIGNSVTVFAYLFFGVSTTAALIGGLPFTSNAACVSTGTIFESSPAPGTVGGIAVLPSSASINFNQVYAGGASFFQLSITYFV